MENSESQTKIYNIFKEFEAYPHKFDELLCFYESELQQRIKSKQIDRVMVDIFIDYLIFCEKIKKSYAKKLFSNLIEKKIIEIRAMTLDFLSDDYYIDCETKVLRMPDSWMIEIINDVLTILQLKNNTEKDNLLKNQNHLIEISNKTNFSRNKHRKYRMLILETFIPEFLTNSEDVFLGQMQFKKTGNQLVLNFMYFYEIMSQYTKIERDFLFKIYQNIEENHRIKFEEISQFLHQQID